MRIYKIFRATEWRAFDDAGETEGAPVDVADGYIHFSTHDQVGETLAKHFKGETGLILAAAEADDMGDALKWEAAREGQDFPHLYRVLKRDEILWHKEIPRDGIDQLALGEE
ncbi:hypothetical protein PARPLA_01146 [Rhodobacteraceae bacterium THAF1]|uniref:DUF952 domain-containing protein n=1 Tax=Palleronia sp. THAF1 TaxID=2587842 RepID=UPI000F3B9FC6|nr:DUF952 domain-containing protein [Palleronia sp. THAF1]QFU07331.1 hypothetical protein FIU81_01450 [Palleronia sp. THAF1]VDC20757.1 hypothetical protein PARPLA_01146 [Rhodobacteraceae bacterium THAF1]